MAQEIDFRSPVDLAGEPDPVKRIRLAEELAEQAKRLAGDYYRVRREAIAEMVAAGMANAEVARQIGTHRNKVGDAIAQVAADDRELFDEALTILAREGVSGASGAELMSGLVAADVEPKARRVQFGAKHVISGRLSDEETALVARAARRAVMMLGPEATR